MSTQDLRFKPLDQQSVNPERIEGALVFSAVGDALGWPTEFLAHRRSIESIAGTTKLTDFVPWTKIVGGRYWGYREQIDPGEYSDDTQLTLSVARCLDEHGDFDTERFAYLELPMWLAYEKGGGVAIKAAARALVQKKRTTWLSNFYRTQAKAGIVRYRTAGGNGAAMRILPIALAEASDLRQMRRDIFFNSISTHGHPRAIVGALLYGTAIAFLCAGDHDRGKILREFLLDQIDRFDEPLDHPQTELWLKEWNATNTEQHTANFVDWFRAAKRETSDFLKNIGPSLRRPSLEYYHRVGGLNPRTRGSGTSTVCIALYLFSKYLDDPESAVLEAANAIGSDTDTISFFVGGLFGSTYGLPAVPDRFSSRLQDRAYFRSVAQDIHRIITGEAARQRVPAGRIDKRNALLKIFAWEIGLHELFWDAIDVGAQLTHPVLGRGSVLRRKITKVAREGYLAKLVKVAFDCGQTCTFHSRVSERTNAVSESFVSELREIFRPIAPQPRRIARSQL